MPKRLGLTDLKILEGLGIYGPRNISQLARKLRMSNGLVRRRIQRMQARKLLWLHANIYHTNLGLKKAVVLAEATQGNEKLLPECLKANDFWIYVSRCYGRIDGCLGIYTIPKDHCNNFEEFTAKLEEQGVAKNIQLFWSTCFHKVNLTTNWFDEEPQEWIFPWKKWIDETLSQGTRLPYTLKDPKDFQVKGDYVDVFILKEMEKDAAIDFKDIAEKLGLTIQGVKYHYSKHVLERGLLENFDIEFFPFNELISDRYLFIFRFPNNRKMTKFACSLLNKPFVSVLGKILQQPAMVSSVYLPKIEFKNFLDSISILIRKGVVKSYFYVIQHSGEWSRQTLSYEFFQNKTWIYNHQKHIKTLERLTESRASP